MRTALLLAALLITAPSAAACAITVTFPLKYDFKKAPAVFEGTLERIDNDTTYYFRVTKRWKGPDAETYAISNPPTSCAYTGLRVGESYLVVPDRHWAVQGGSHIAPAGAEKSRLIDRRARWWNCPLSSFTLSMLRERIFD
jgi:hypothetical protein